MLKKYIKENKTLTNFAGILVLVFLFLATINYFNISYPLAVSQRTVSGELSVVGVGKVEATPDTASVNLGIVANNASTIEAAQKQINEVNNAIVNGLTALGISKENIKTSNYSINPNYDYSEGGSGRIIGYNGNATITVKVEDTSILPQVIEAGTRGGANEVMGTNYSIEEPEKYQRQARDLAIENAKTEAQRLADQLGIKLGKIVNIVESSGGNGPIPMLYDKALSAEGRGGGMAPLPDLQPGTQTITSTVTLYFEKR